MIGKLLGILVGVVACCVLVGAGVTQEVPVGRLTGKLVMLENGKPLPHAVITVTPVVPEEDQQPKGRGVETHRDGTFAFNNLPAGEYKLDLSADEHSMSGAHIEIEEGKTTHVDYAAKPNDPFVELYASQHVFTPDEVPKVELHGFVQASSVDIEIYRLDVGVLAANGGLEQTLSPYASSEGASEHRLDHLGKKYKDLSHPILKRDAEGAFVEALPVGQLPEGYYYVTCEAGGHKAAVVLCVSSLALVTKSYLGKSLCYSTDLRTGQPIPDVDILAQGARGLIHVGRTGADGTADIRLLRSRELPDVLVGEKGDSVALVGLGTRDGSPEKYKIYGYCERPAYRPGDEVHFKGIIRAIGRDGYRLPGTGTASVDIEDPDGNRIDEMTAPISAHGTFSGQFTTSPESKPGSYTVKVHAFGVDSDGIGANIVAYGKPEYSIEVNADRPYYVMGNRASATVECRYYYGGPVVGATVKATITRSPVFSYGDDQDDSGDEEMFSFGLGGEYSQTVNTTTDANGKARVEFDTRSDNDPDEFNNDYSYGVQVSVSEDQGKEFNGEGDVLVVRGEYELTAEVQNPVVSPGETVDMLVKTLTVDKPRKPVPNRPVTVEVGREAWTQSTSVFIQKGSYDAVTRADGTVHVMIPAPAGDSLSFRVRSVDNEGHHVVASAWAYVEGSPAQAQERKGTIKVTLDHKRYLPGDQGRALVQTDMPGGSALLCVQAEGVLWRQVVPITSTSTIVRFPVVKEYAPNAFVTVAYVREKKFLRADRRLRVTRTDRDLHVVVKTDRDVYKPGETAQVTLQTTDGQGKPVPADVSVGVVDAGVYDIAEDETDIAGAMYPDRSDEVRTNYSFPVIYLDGGDKGSSKVPLRTRFRDTAFWTPSVWTGPNGTARVPVPLPDNLTAWRVTAVGVSDATLVGMTKSTFHARKQLMVRLELPQFMIDGDRQRMTVVVTNDTGEDQEVNVELDGEGVKLDTKGSQTIRVPNGKPQVVEYNMTAGGPGSATLTAKAWIVGGLNDGVRQSFPIEPHGRKVAASGSGEGTGDVELPVLATADPKFGALDIHLSPTLAGGLVSSLDGLIGFPYGCVEQTMSRFLPSILVAKTVKELGLPQPKHLAELPKIVRDALSRLEAMHHNDGGWGWWDYDQSNTFMTALVLDGLDLAKAAGWDVDLANPSKAVEWGMQQLKDKSKKGPSLRDRVYLTYTLLRWGKKEAAGYLDGLNLPKLSPAELATAALALHEAGRASEADDAVDRLIHSAQGGDASAYWPPESGAWGDEASAVALVAIETVRPRDPILPRIVRYLMATRKGDMWQSTRDSAYVLVGLTEYLRETRELAGTASVEVSVNGKAIRTVELDPKASDDPNWLIQIPRAELGNGPVRVHIGDAGPGACYYTVQLSTLDIAPELKPESTGPGLQVVRTYHRLEPRALENGTTRLLPSRDPVDRFASGDLLRVELTVTSDVPRQYVMIEEPTPSSCHVEEREDVGEFEQWTWWWSRTVTRDDRIAFFATYLPKGVSKIAYTMRAEEAGKVRVLPTRVDNMYDPALTAYSAEAGLEVTK